MHAFVDFVIIYMYNLVEIMSELSLGPEIHVKKALELYMELRKKK